MTEKLKESNYFRAQCECGHIILEQYKFTEPQAGLIGFYWCGFCRTRTNIVSETIQDDTSYKSKIRGLLTEAYKLADKVLFNLALNHKNKMPWQVDLIAELKDRLGKEIGEAPTKKE